MKKRLLSMLLVVSMVLSLISVPVMATEPEIQASGTCGDNLTWTLSVDGTFTISGAGEMEMGEDYKYVTDRPWYPYLTHISSLIIAEGVTSIYSNAFYDCVNLQSVSFPSSLKIIGNFAFSNCDSLVEVVVPDNVVELGHGAFAYCDDLEHVVLSSALDEIKSQTFMHTGLCEIVIPESVTSIGAYAFDSCRKLHTVHIPDGLHSIGTAAFVACSLEEIVLPDSVKEIGESAFAECNSITDIYIPTGVESIGVGAFSKCSRLNRIEVSDINLAYCSCDGVLFDKTKTVLLQYPIGLEEEQYEIPGTVAEIEDEAFWRAGIKKITFSSDQTLVRIGEVAFFDCAYLESINIPGSVTSIGRMAFAGCERLNGVTIPNSVRSLGIDAFRGCSNLCEVRFEGNAPDMERPESVFPWSVTIVYTRGASGWTDGKYYNAAEKTWYGYELKCWNCISDPGVSNGDFNRYIYQANSLDRTDFPSIANIRASLTDESFASMMAKEAKKTGFNFSSCMWNLCNTISDVYDDPTTLVDLAVEPKDIYTAIIMNALETELTNEINLIRSEYEASVKWCSAFVSAVNEGMKTKYSIDLTNRYNYNNLNAEQQAYLRDLTQKFFKHDQPELVEMGQVFSGVVMGLNIVGSIQDYYERIVTCMLLANMSESMKQAVIETYEYSKTCGNTALMYAMKDCVKIITSSQEELILQLVQDGATAIGKQSLSYLVKELFWKDVKASITASCPLVAVIQGTFKGGKVLCNFLGNSDRLAEQNTRIAAVTEVEKLFDYARGSMKATFKQDQTENNAHTYLSSVDLAFGIRQAGCDEVELLIKAVDSAVLSKVFGKDFSADLDAINTQRAMLRSAQRLAQWAWVDLLPEDYPNTGLYEYYSAQQTQEWNSQAAKGYSIHCPVDVFVYDQQDNLVAYVEGERVSTTVDDITVIRNGDQKELWFDDDSKYRIEYVGTDSGDMDVTVQEYNGNEEVTRTVSFFDVPLENQQQYDMYVETVAESDDIYHLLTDTETEVVEDYDSLTEDVSKHTLTVNSGVLVRENGPEKSASVAENELVSLIANVPEGFRFLGWESSDKNAVFTDPMQMNTEVRMTGHDLTVWPVVEPAEGGGFVLALREGTEDTIAVQLSNGNAEIQDVVFVLSAYDGDGKLIGMKMTVQQLDTRERIELSVKPSSVEEVAQVKAMVLENGTYAPLCEAWVREF